jgi:hypothetical protein
VVDSTGVRISSTGVYPGNPQYFNLAYQAGGDSCPHCLHRGPGHAYGPRNPDRGSARP